MLLRKHVINYLTHITVFLKQTISTYFLKNTIWTLNSSVSIRTFTCVSKIQFGSLPMTIVKLRISTVRKKIPGIACNNSWIIQELLRSRHLHFFSHVSLDFCTDIYLILWTIIISMSRMNVDSSDGLKWHVKYVVCSVHVVFVMEKLITIISSLFSLLSFPTYLCLRSGSTPTVGSSRMRSSGSCISATAKDTRLCCPPLHQQNEKWDTKLKPIIGIF